MSLLTENHLDEWVRAHSRDAQGVVVELVWRLVAASSPRPKERRFPLGDSIGQHGPDGILNVESGFNPFVPDGSSLWEIGTSLNAGDKATSDYRELTEAVPETVRRDSAFTFVTPLSGRRDWEHTWKEDAQGDWLENRRRRAEWRDVRVIDGTKLVDWLHHFPSVEFWLAERLGLPIEELEIPEQHWAVVRSIGTPPPLTPRVFLVGREEACAKLKEVFTGGVRQLKIETHFPDQVVDFVCAFIADMDAESRVDAVGRCIILTGPNAWNAITTRRDAHILIANFDLDERSGAGTKLLEKAHRAGHVVVFGAGPGGLPHPNRVALPNPRAYQLKEALEAAGYGEERARTLAQKSDGHLTSLLRVLQHLSTMPEWAAGTAAGDLAIAQLLGAWDERSDADRHVAERVSGKAYGEWIATIREIAARPGTPLTHRDGVWKSVARYEAWYALGSRLFDEHLDRVRDAAVAVLREQDPKFDLPPDERHAAAVHGKALVHSGHLRRGLAETLALLGSHPKALAAASLGKAEDTAILAVRSLFDNADWKTWASLNDLTPLLAEAAPAEFLNCVESALGTEPSPLAGVFAQEGTGVVGWNYMTGVLWALETLAWETDHLGRVVLILGELAKRDPGGSWANRPDNSLSTILLPWLPQTSAPVSARKAAVAALLAESPDVGWRLLLNLLPSIMSSSTGSRRPVWRETVPEHQGRQINHREYWQQIAIYADLAVEVAQANRGRLTALIERLPDLPQVARGRVLRHLDSMQIQTLSEEERLPLWTELMDLVTKHRKFATAKWAMAPSQVDKVAAVAERIAPRSPTLRYRRLFTERGSDLYEDTGDYAAQRNQLELRRDSVIREIYEVQGREGVVKFAKATETPWRVGLALGAVASAADEHLILPEFLVTEDRVVAQFAGGFVLGRFRHRGWSWIDGIDVSTWTTPQVGQLFAYLPFVPETWARVKRILGEAESAYWTQTNANPYDADGPLGVAVEELIKHGRPHAAIRCLRKMQYDKRPIDAPQVAQALLAALHSRETHATDGHELAALIKILQGDPNTDPELLFRVEWNYLPILDGHTEALPRTLERRLADDPRFFCELIRLVFRSEGVPADQGISEDMKAIATNAYRLLLRWRTAPGTGHGTGFDGVAFMEWLNAVKQECGATGHLGSAMVIVGHVLVYAPADPGGLWIHRTAAAALDASDARAMREGFRTELFNNRGVHTFTSGQEELQIAGRYRDQAERVAEAGFHRLAGALRDLASSYERDAERDSSRDPFDR